jgi:hypothetical protein
MITPMTGHIPCQGSVELRVISDMKELAPKFSRLARIRFGVPFGDRDDGRVARTFGSRSAARPPFVWPGRYFRTSVRAQDRSVDEIGRNRSARVQYHVGERAIAAEPEGL